MTMFYNDENFTCLMKGEVVFHLTGNMPVPCSILCGLNSKYMREKQKHVTYYQKVQEGNDQEMAQSERKSHSKDRSDKN